MDEARQRHGCLTAWLILTIVASAFAAAVFLLVHNAVATQFPSGTAWAMPVLLVTLIANIVFAVALLRWRKWGFYGMVVDAIVAAFVDVMVHVRPASLVGDLVGIVLLYVLLQIGGERKAWDRLR